MEKVDPPTMIVGGGSVGNWGGEETGPNFLHPTVCMVIAVTGRDCESFGGRC